MKKFLLLLFIAILFSCKSTTNQNDESINHKSNYHHDASINHKSNYNHSTTVNYKNFDKDVIKIVNNMTTRQKIGQVMLVNFRYCKLSESTENKNKVTDFETSYNTIEKVVPLDSVNDTIKNAIKKYHIGNVILFAENFLTLEKSMKFINEIQLIAKQNKDLPLIMSVDQEGGRVNRIFFSKTLPSSSTLSKTGKKEFAFTQAKLIGTQLNALNIDLDFAPVCDVNSNPLNPVIGDRSFSNEPQTVSIYANEFFKGLKSKNIISCAKHFPGHGDTNIDSHLGLPLIQKSKSKWQKTELIPFKYLIQNEIPVIMTAHIQYPALDNTKIYADKTQKNIYAPATLSKKILTNLLREELNFKGVICTDALDMKAISSNFSESKAIIYALNAGADLICNPISIIQKSDLSRFEKIYKEIEKELQKSPELRNRLDESVLRIVQLKKDYKILDNKILPVTNDEILKAKKIFSSNEYGQFIDSVNRSVR